MADRTKVDETVTTLLTAVRQEVPSPSGRAVAQASGLHGSVPVHPVAAIRRFG